MTIEQLITELFYLNATTTNLFIQIGNDKLSRDYRIKITKGVYIRDSSLKKCLLTTIKTIRDNRKITNYTNSIGSQPKLYTFTQNKE